MYPAFRGFYERNSLIEQGRMKIVQGIELQTLASGSRQIDIEGTLCGTRKTKYPHTQDAGPAICQ